MKEVSQQDYKKMYLTLFNSITSALECLSQDSYERAGEILKEGQIKAEEIYLDAEV